MKILYLSVHEILEYDEVKLLHELGHEVYSLGAYTQPSRADDKHGKRPGLPQLPYDPHFIELSLQCTKENLHPELIAMFDTIIVMHEPSLVEKNWENIKHKRVIWRSIGQSIPQVEERLAPFRAQGLQIVRYSPYEESIRRFVGSDAMIRFYKDETEYDGWHGHRKEIVNFTQSLMQRGRFCGYETIRELSIGLPVKVYGPGNDDLGNLAGGMLSYEEQLSAMRFARAFLYAGTYPASYTLSFIECWMMGVPVVAVGNKLGNGEMFTGQSTYEVADLIENGMTGFVSDSTEELRDYLKALMDDQTLANRIGDAGRAKAIELFGRETIAEQWRKFLC